ncbi:MAG TPA: hypothetical protein VK195_05180 [Burkholderiaceae bacterium]|nr:hypothetical protein [Burkholderiaceae bacterium]
MKTYWVLASTSGDGYVFAYYPSLKVTPQPNKPCAGQDKLPLAPNFDTPALTQLPTGTSDTNLQICQVQAVPAGMPVPAPNLRLLGTVSKTLDRATQDLPNWAGQSGVQVATTQGGLTVGVIVPVAVTQPPAGTQIKRGLSLAFQHYGSDGFPDCIYCSPDPAAIIPGPGE